MLCKIAFSLYVNRLAQGLDLLTFSKKLSLQLQEIVSVLYLCWSLSVRQKILRNIFSNIQRESSRVKSNLTNFPKGISGKFEKTSTALCCLKQESGFHIESIKEDFLFRGQFIRLLTLSYLPLFLYLPVGNQIYLLNGN